MKQDLLKLPNVGEVLANQLCQVGIDSPEALQSMGSKDAFLRIRVQVDPEACINKLYSLEGAVQGVRWHALPEEVKAQLKGFHRSL